MGGSRKPQKTLSPLALSMRLVLRFDLRSRVLAVEPTSERSSGCPSSPLDAFRGTAERRGTKAHAVRSIPSLMGYDLW